ncbi:MULTISPECIES: type II toxin-antitoxin system RelB/DinJ family antitoxin [Olsenella]|uniref:type II toxin-antitoxin system RelB/DinJ family antitoxin n=1 Tax=Olsenella TaxID=133925 RepID=UPI000231F098|nr:MULTISPECIES: type II toxin-antitoxin system RelB/DinJ family antitoxin [Olsenella]EHF02972.1 hypothetical protein HMPREF1008_00013 [Olsenella sp. oral taxon 809 str. F0356]KXB63251.1 addiction module antitoxin, RelB/DinJ family [Olsenella sp. DNF00959]
MATVTPPHDAEIKTRAPRKVRDGARKVYARWGISLNDAINMFLVKSIEVGGLPFDLRPEAPSFEELSALAYKAQLDSSDTAILPADWDEDE